MKPAPYLKNKPFTEEVRRCLETGEMSDTMAKNLILLVDKIASKGSFASYTNNYKEEMVGKAITDLCTNWHKFDGSRNNAFAYYTSCVINSFRLYLNAEKRQRKIRDELMIKEGYDPSFNYQAEYEQESD